MRRSGRLVGSVALGVLLGAAPASADAAGGTPVVTQAQKPPANDPRRGPRLVYTRGAPACLPEASFRDEVAIILDGVDHFDATAAEEVRVTFEKLPNGYRGTVVHTNASGVADAPTVKSYHSCEMLGRWIAGTASTFIPGPPAPKATAAPAVAPSIAASAPPVAPSIAASAIPAASDAPALSASAAPSIAASAIPAPAVSSAGNDSAPAARSFRPCMPSREPRDILMLITCAGVAATLASGGAAVGLEAHFQSMRGSLVEQGYVISSCDAPDASPECTEIHRRLVQRDQAVAATITSGFVAGVLAVATTIFIVAGPRQRSSRSKAPHPSIALTAGPEGGGFGFLGAW